jgi:PleD family two-component response regulator
MNRKRNTSADNARIYAEKLHLLIDSREFAGVRQVTRSFGVARLCVDTVDRFMQRADDALFRAKTLGRDRVETA